MKRVAETGILDKIDLPDGMAASTTARDAEGTLAIMAGTARLSLLHLAHGESFGHGAGGENSEVAIIAPELLVNVIGMAEDHPSTSRDLPLKILGRGMASITAAVGRKGDFPFMAGTA